MTESAPERTMALGRKGAALPTDAPPGDCRIVLYREGERQREVDTLARAHEDLRADPSLFAWVELSSPNREQLTEAARRFDLPRLAVEDAIVAHQRPKVESYGDVLFVVLRPASYDEAQETVHVGEVHVFGARGVVITIRHDTRIDFAPIRARLEEHPRLMRHGALGVTYAVLDRVVDDYAPVIAALQEDVDDVESQVFAGEKGASRRTYRLARQVIALQRAVDPLGEVLRMLMTPREGADRPLPAPLRPAERHLDELREYLRDVADHVSVAGEHVDGFRQLLQNIMAVESSLIDQAQNEAMKKVSSWGGILVVPTLISSIYGMNIAPVHGYHWLFSWPLTLCAMVLIGLGLYMVFKRNGWL
ncbi:magnesium and cobalt transport protein CorA [Nocardiopsis sp. MG754419]|uniref:magnesium and cobalt transport protein CorA n=1 Tax=Nocardiopsis sp. MG754419 TaxID=2259865 RepID=UPI001BA81354|nr:magnesium and cobalt transport protein CorA [Nocardiopsis sp. MG754419]MBR8740838.1 magnesium and cobalt transport protein CorA [Nocardiopsis sp. MG754419]